jgi:hypothetical protein
MDKQELFATWAPPGSPWSAWAKPVLFAHLPRPLPPVYPQLLLDLSWVPAITEHWAVVVELPGPEAVAIGMALAERGYRPVPLFNACPPPLAAGDPVPPLAVVNVEGIMAHLVGLAGRLSALALPDDAPPAFLVDAGRHGPPGPVNVGLFDNRSILFVTDFPSAIALAAHNIRRALLISQRSRLLTDDLAYVLRTWQKAGVTLARKNVDDVEPIQPLTIGGFWLLFQLGQRLWAWAHLRRGFQGAFGGFVPASG